MSSVDGIKRFGRSVRIHFGVVHSDEILGTISMGQSIVNKNNIKPQTKVVHGYFTIEQLRKVRREISRILLDVELKNKHTKERNK
jgi:hypothetical protein